MYWRSEKEIIDEFTSVLRRIFSYVGELENKDKELLTLPTGSLPGKIYESFASREEVYPQIQIDSGGVVFKDGLNNLMSVVTGEEYFLGYSPDCTVEVSYNYPLKVQIPEHLFGSSARGFVISFASIGYQGGDNVEVKVYKNYSTTPTLEASGSLLGNPSNRYLMNFVELSENISFEDEDWWMELIPAEDNKYYFGIDKGIESSYTYFENGIEQTSTGTLHASILSPAFVRVGGLLEGSILIKCSSKDDSKTARDMSSVVSLYCNLLKHSQINRKSNDKLQLVMGIAGGYDEWIEKGIRIRGIRQNPMNYRRRSSNEIIYESTVIVDIETDWFQDFDAQTLEEISVDVYNIIPHEFRKINVTIRNDQIS